MSSLRAKIITSFGVSKVALLLFAAVVVGDLYYLQNQILRGQPINAFYAAAQEIRRDEKNLFLYRDSAALARLLDQLDAVEVAMDRGREAFAAITSETERRSIKIIVPNYRQQLEGYFGLPEDQQLNSQRAIRQSGQDLLLLAKQLSSRERDHLAETARAAAVTLLVALLIVILLGIGAAFFVLRQVVRPLRELERQLDEVADGNVREIDIPTKDSEIQSFVRHFNAMLQQQREQQNQVRNREKTCALGVLASGVAHELNNPLSNISTSAQLLAEDGDTADPALRRQWLAHIDEESERARRIVRRLLDSVRQTKPHLRELSTLVLLEDSVSLVQRQLPAGVIARVSKASGHPVIVDRERMQQVFINLIKNAADAGATEISLSAEATDWQSSAPNNFDHLVGDTARLNEAQEVILIYIDDNGGGISDKHLPQVFDPFFTSGKGGEGTGLGLYLVEEIVSEHGGCIMVGQRPEGGTRFTIWLPYNDDDEEADHE